MREWIRHEAASGERFLVNARLAEAGVLHVFTLRPTAQPPTRDVPAAKTAEATVRRTSSNEWAAGHGSEEPVRALAAAGFRARRVARPRQVHGSVVARLDESGEATMPAEADGVLVDRGGFAAAVATADCVGGILFAPRTGAFAVLHAGWRGILAGIVQMSISSLSAATSTPRSEMLLATGPAVGGCCYEVGEDVERPFAALFTETRERAEIFGSKDGLRTLDPPAAVRILAGRAGLAPERILPSGLCTMCRPDLCWSWRVHGRAAGRMWTAAALPA